MSEWQALPLLAWQLKVPMQLPPWRVLPSICMPVPEGPATERFPLVTHGLVHSSPALENDFYGQDQCRRVEHLPCATPDWHYYYVSPAKGGPIRVAETRWGQGHATQCTRLAMLRSHAPASTAPACSLGPHAGLRDIRAYPLAACCMLHAQAFQHHEGKKTLSSWHGSHPPMHGPRRCCLFQELCTRTG